MAYYKDKRQANRGQPLETFIRFANERYRRHGIAVISKQATEFIPLRDNTGKIANVKVETKSTVDFLGRYKQYPIAIEAKNTNSGSIRFDAIQPHQADYMDLFTEQAGTIGLVVVSFNFDNFYAIPWVFWQAAYNARVRNNPKSRSAPSRESTVTANAFGQCWDIPKKLSVRMEELNPLWKVSSQHNRFGLHYLEHAEKYITPMQP